MGKNREEWRKYRKSEKVDKNYRQKDIDKKKCENNLLNFGKYNLKDWTKKSEMKRIKEKKKIWIKTTNK